MIAAGLRSAFPWGVEGGVRSTLLALASSIGLAVVWFEVSDQGVFQDQVGWLSAGILLVLVASYAETTMIVRGRRAVGQRRSRLVNDALADLELMPPTHVGRGVAKQETTAVVVVRGLGLFHIGTCAMVEHRAVTELQWTAALGAGLDPCELCCPAASGVSTSTPGGRG